MERSTGIGVPGADGERQLPLERCISGELQQGGAVGLGEQCEAVPTPATQICIEGRVQRISGAVWTQKMKHVLCYFNCITHYFGAKTV